MDKKKILFDFIKSNTLAVLSTVNEKNQPESAVLEFGETEELEIIFDTFKNARKYKNLKKNKNISFVIGWDKNITVQYNGIAEELSGEELEKYKKIYFKKNPEAQRWETQEGITYFKAVPKWVRYSDLNKNPWEIIELNL